MAETTLNIRLKQKYDTYQNWLSANPVLLQGETVYAVIPASTGTVASEPIVLSKTGDGTTVFRELPWNGGLAADVYPWAKTAGKPGYSASEIGGLTDFINAAVQDTDTQYKLEQDAADAHILKLFSKPLGGSWTVAGTITTADTVYDDTAITGRVAAAETKLSGIEAGAQVNLIEGIQVNGANQTVAGKKVNIAVPIKVSDLSNDSKYQSESQVSASIQAAIAATGHASFVKAEVVPTAAQAEENKLYLVMNAQTKHYDIYAKVSGEVVLLDDTTVDLSAYSTTEQMNALLGEKVDKVDGKGLSANDYTSGEKAKLEGIAAGAQVNVLEAVKVNGSALSPGADKSVNITVPTGTLAGKNKVAEADLESSLSAKISGKADASSLSALAVSGDAKDLVQTAGDYIILDCGSATVNI